MPLCRPPDVGLKRRRVEVTFDWPPGRIAELLHLGNLPVEETIVFVTDVLAGPANILERINTTFANRLLLFDLILFKVLLATD